MIKGSFIFIVSLLTMDLTSPEAVYGGPLYQAEAKRKAEHIVQILNNQNQKVISIVLRKMKWTYYSDYARERRRNKQCRKTVYQMLH
jgi:hypothetical protein